MTLVSVNLNKFALLRNSRDNDLPNVKYIANLAIIGGCKSITVHPRQDKRHITEKDVATISALAEVASSQVGLNIEGDIRDDIMRMVLQYNTTQFTVVPVQEGEKTTERGFNPEEKRQEISEAMKLIKSKKSVEFVMFVEPNPASVEYAHSLGFDAVEIHTKYYARSFCTHRESEEVTRVNEAALLARKLKMRVHLGHDLNLVNLSMIVEKVQPDEVSIGHSVVVDSILQGFPRTIKRYLAISNLSK